MDAPPAQSLTDFTVSAVAGRCAHTHTNAKAGCFSCCCDFARQKAIHVRQLPSSLQIVEASVNSKPLASTAEQCASVAAARGKFASPLSSGDWLAQRQIFGKLARELRTLRTSALLRLAGFLIWRYARMRCALHMQKLQWAMISLHEHMASNCHVHLCSNCAEPKQNAQFRNKSQFKSI